MFSWFAHGMNKLNLLYIFVVSAVYYKRLRYTTSPWRTITNLLFNLLLYFSFERIRVLRTYFDMQQSGNLTHLEYMISLVVLCMQDNDFKKFS